MKNSLSFVLSFIIYNKTTHQLTNARILRLVIGYQFVYYARLSRLVIGYQSVTLIYAKLSTEALSLATNLSP